MNYNKVDYISDEVTYCTTHNVKVPFLMPEFSISKIILHRFYTDKNYGESGIGYDMIISHDLTVPLGLMTNLKRQLLQWDGDVVPMK